MTPRRPPLRRAPIGRVAIGAAVAALALSACGGSSEPATADDPVAAPVTSAPDAGDVPADAPSTAVPAALDFSAPLLGGGEIEMGELAGRPVLLWFWAPW